MIVPAFATAVLGELDASEWANTFRRGFRDECSETHAYIVVVIIAALCAVLLIVRLVRRHRPGIAAPVDYLAEAARRLGLSRTELQDLQNVARQAGLPQPAAMLLSPANLTHAIQAARADANHSSVRRRLDRLSRNLFGVPLPDEAPSDQPAPPTAV